MYEQYCAKLEGKEDSSFGWYWGTEEEIGDSEGDQEEGYQEGEETREEGEEEAEEGEGG